MGFKQDFKKATQELKKKKKQESIGFKSDFKNALGEIRNNAGQSRNKTTLTPTIQTTKTNQNLVTNPLIKGMVNEADKTSASNRVDVRELATNLLVRDIEDRAKEIAQDNYQKSRALSAMRRTPSASAGGDFMNDFLSSDAFYYNLSDNDDFQEYTEKGKARTRTNIVPSKDSNFDKYTMGNRVEETRKGYDVSMHYDGAGGKVGQMTDDEVAIYNYLLAKYGYDSAEAYVKSLEGELNNRLGKGVADAVTNASPLEKLLLYPGMSAARGLEQVVTGFDTSPAYLSGTKGVLSSTPMEIASEEVRDSIDSKIGRLLFDAGANVAAQVPRIGIGALTGRLGSFATTFLQSAGNDYRQAILEGRDPNKAQWHATGTGTLEASLQTLLNAAGGKMGIGPKTLTSKANLINNAFARSAAKFGIDMGSEILEEEGQLFLEPVLDTIIYGDDFSVPELDEIVDTALTTMISTGVLSGPNIVGVTSNDNSQLGQEFRGFNDNDTDIVEVAIEEGLSTPKGSESYTIAKALDKKVKNGGEVSDHQLGTLIEANRRNVNYEAEADVDTTSSETFTQDTRGMSLEDRIIQAKAKEGVTLETPITIDSNAKVGTVDQKTIKSFGYGKMGTEAITDIVSKTNMAPEQARRRFQSAYEAGRLNLDRSKIDLIDGIQETAYIAGRKDAILEMDTLEGNDVSSWGKKAGLVKNEFSAKYDKKTYSTVNTIAKAMGTKVIVENIPQEMNSNGYYRSSDGTIHIDANLDDPVMTVVKHEITHRMKDLAPKEYMAYRDFAVEVMSDWGLGSKTAVESIQFDYHDRGNIDLDVESAMDEIAADMTRAILSDEKALKRFIDHAKTSKANMNMANKFFQAVRDFIDKVKATFSGNRQKMDEVTMDEFGLTLEQLERAESLWKEAYRASETSAKKINKAKIKTKSPESGAVYDKSGTRFDAERLSSSELGGVLYSLKHNNDIAEGQNKYLNTKKSYISEAELKQAQEVTRAMVDVMMKYSSILPEDKIGKVLTKNGSYDRSVENTTICVRTLAYNEFVDKVQEELGRPLSQMESFLVSQKMYDIATDPQCMYCYVSLDRKAFNDMLLRYIQDRDTVIEKYNKSDKSPETVERLYDEFLNKRKPTKEMRTRFDKWLDYADNGTQILSLADIATEERQSTIKANGGILAEQLVDARKYAQSASWAKIQKNYVAYRDEILKLGDRVVKNLNEHYGLRWYSFSDYSAAFIVENMQQITDASIRGLKGLAYTKDTDFVEIFAPSGMNINISVFVNKDADGKFYIDERQSANIKKAIELRKQYPNVGIVATVTTDEALRWAAEQEWSDVIIPFHIVRTGADVAEYYKWLNYTNESGDSVKDKDLWSSYVDSLNIKSESARRKVSKNIYPSEHNNDKDTYLNLCESRGLTPRFARFTGEDWYMKLVNETRLSADKSSPLKPKYNLDAAQKSFQKFINKGGYEGGWYKNGVDIDAEAKAVADDVRAGKKANEVEYGRQDGFLPEEVAAKRRKLRMHGNDIYHSLKKGDNRITRSVVETIQSMDGKPINDFTSDDIKKTEPFAKKYFEEMGVKSPFFRAWFGDWRANDKSPIHIVTEKGAKKGTTKNKDTNWSIQISGKVFNETKVQSSSKIKKAVPYLDYIEGIVENAVLLDTHTISREKAKSENSALMHSLYAVANNGNGQEILKLLVEELNDVNSDGTIFRSYQLQDVIKIPTASVRVQNNPSSLTNTVGNIDSVSDLFDFVKQNDKDFNPKPVSGVVNEDGTPMIVYHGTDARFDVFDMSKGRANMDIQGSFFSPWELDAKGYGKNVDAYYLSIKNPADGDTAFAALNRFKGQDKAGIKAREYLISKGYDGVNFYDEEYVAFEPTQIKSATDNIGTFDKNDPDIHHSLKGESKIMKDFRRMRAGEISPEEFEKRYDALVEQHGAIAKGENPAREIEVPRKTADGKKVSQTARTILEAGVTPDEVLPDIKAMVTSGVFSYDVYTDKKAIEDAEERINSKTWNKTLNKWLDDVKKGKVSKANTALGWALYNNAVNTAKEATSITEKESATNTALDILNAMVGHQRSAAQALQATRILKKLSPETQLYNTQKTVESLQEELKEKHGKDAPELKIDRELAQKFLEAETQEERDNIYKEIYRDIGRQMPSNWVDKFNALRYFAMLGNVRTHIRNVVGNAAFVPIVTAKNVVATGIESTLRVATKGKFQGNKAILNATNKNDRALIQAAYNDYKNVADIISGNGKYNESVNANKYIEEGKKTFQSKALKPLEKIIKGNSALLEIEDVWFSKPHYAYALAQYCKAHNITAEQIEKGIAILPARTYAIKEAQKATYKDTNALSQTISGLGRARKDDNIVKKAVAVGLEGTLPFRRTPANILARGIEYSPIGIVKSLSYDIVQAKKGEITAADVVDNLSAGLTGTGLVALGLYLAAQGLVRGHGGEDEKEKEYNEMIGHQAYSLEVDDTSITLDWLAPEALPFFVGVNLWEMTKGKKENMDMATLLTAIGNVSEPMLEMSCLQGLNDLIESVKFAESDGMDSLPAMAASAVTSYFSQYVPTLLGQFERTSQKERMTTYAEKNQFLTKGMQRTLGKVSAKIPGWDFNQIPYIDAWGRKEVVESKFVRGLNNFLNPAYMSNIETSDMEKELLRLYKSTGEGIVLPKRADSSFNIDGEEKVLTGEEYVRYATKKGQISYDMITELVNSDEYQKFTDAEKVEAIEKTYDYANQKAKNAVSNYNPEKWVNILDNVGVVNYSQYRRNLDEIDDNDSYSLSEKADALSSMDLSNDELAYLWDTEEGWKAYKKGIRMSKYIDFKDAAAGFKADKDKNGKTISGSKKEKVVKYLNKSKLRDKEWDYFYYELMDYKK